MFSRPWLVTILATSFIATPLVAQNTSATRGFTLGAHLTGASLDPEDGDTDSGGGGGIFLAYGFRSGLSIFLNGDVAVMEPSDDEADNYVLAEAELGIRYTFGTTAQRWRPFLQAGVGGVTVAWENVDFGEFGRSDVEIRGGSFALGGGVQYFLSPGWALDGTLQWGTGSFDEVEVDRFEVDLEDEVKLNTFRLQLGFQYFFSHRNP